MGECDDGDSCTLNTCNNGLCVSTPDCASCGKSKVDVEITIDNYGEETTYEIKDSSGAKVMGGSGWPANSVNSFWQCFSSGSYTFKITDAYGDGICCSYGNGGYIIKVDGTEVVSGGEFGDSETETFTVSSATAPPTTAPVTPTTSPVTSPTVSCTTCDDVATPKMIKKGKNCATSTNLQQKCTKPKWMKKKYCQLSCYNAGVGYDGDVCCNGATS